MNRLHENCIFLLRIVRCFCCVAAAAAGKQGRWPCRAAVAAADGTAAG